MLSMQEFRDWLTKATETSGEYRRDLADMTRASLTEILNVRSELAWWIWTSDQPAKAAED